MDPNETWQQLAEAFKLADTTKLRELAAALMEWMLKDGFPPTITGVAEFDKHVATHTCGQLIYPHHPTQMLRMAGPSRGVSPFGAGGWGPSLSYERQGDS
jgi:hypothetical protein